MEIVELGINSVDRSSFPFFRPSFFLSFLLSYFLTFLLSFFLFFFFSFLPSYFLKVPFNEEGMNE